MDKQQATLLLDQYMQSDSARDLSFRQSDAVVGVLMTTFIDSEDVDVSDVARVVEKLFKENKGMFRPTPQSGKSTQQQQSPQEQKQILAQFLTHNYAALVAPNAVKFVDENGKVVSKINMQAFANAVKAETIYGTGSRPIRHDILSEIILRLDQAGLLEHVPQVVERIVEVEKAVPLTRREEQKHNFNLDKRMNAPGVDAIKGASEQTAKKPVVPQAQLEAQARHDLRENAVMGEINSKIAQHAHHGRSHSATSYERKILEGIRDAGIRAGTPNETIAKQIEAKRSEMTRWSAHEALKQLRPELFTSQKPQGLGY